MMKRKAEVKESEMPEKKKLRIDPEAMYEYQYFGLEDLERAIGYCFRSKWLLIQALTHTSYVNVLTDSYDQLEWMGDRILAFLLSNHIFYGYQRSVDFKSKLFTTMSTNDYLAAVAVKHGFQNYVKVSNRNLRNQIRGFVTAQNKNGHKYIHELSPASHESIAVQGTAPKELADVVEALLGAIYVDSGNSLEAVERTIFRLIVGNPPERLLENPVHIIQKRYGQHVKLKNTTFGLLPCVSVELRGVQICKGAGKNQKGALTAACKYALHILEENV